MDKDKAKIRVSFVIAVFLIILIWSIKLFEEYTHIDLSVYGVYPRSVSGLKGVLFSPLIHSDFSHLISNSTTLFILTFSLFYLYTKSAVRVFFIIYILHGVFVWIFARESYHIGASGLIYGYVGFLFFIGLFRKDSRSIAISLLVIFLYGGLVWGILPTDPHISFEAHLAGGIIGSLCSIFFRKTDPLPEKYEWDYYDDDEEDDSSFEDDINPDDIKIEEDAQPLWFSTYSYPVKKHKKNK